MRVAAQKHTATRPQFRLGARSILAALIAVAGLCWLSLALLVPLKGVLAPILIAHAFDDPRSDGRPWSWADWQIHSKIDFPSMGQSRYTLTGATHRALAFGPTTEVRGEATLMFGHRDTHFELLQNSKIGDQITVTPYGENARQVYEVQAIWTAHKDALYIPEGGHKKGLLLITCYPFGGVMLDRPERFLVWATPVKAHKGSGTE